MDINFPDMEFLEVLTEGLERVMMVRGGGREVITIYSQYANTHSHQTHIPTNYQAPNSTTYSQLSSYTHPEHCKFSKFDSQLVVAFHFWFSKQPMYQNSIEFKIFTRSSNKFTVLIGYSDWPPSRRLRSLQTARSLFPKDIWFKKVICSL